ncbi:capsular biosynthesis protein [Candidatus Atribacteria bacterium HGW-Atribacteria-1]|nr:MAG: capsular biosynthesis protein [Candidatus Atribacteria bacterium HGW-Atribacteria-1]
MLNKYIFKTSYLLKRPIIIRYYNEFNKNQWKSFGWLKNQQEIQLKNLINFVYRNVPYYSKLFNRIDITPSDINIIEDLERIPILTKQIIKENWQDFIPRNINQIKYINGSTGGSTGVPLKYRMSNEDYERGVALLYQGFEYAGYKLGDKIAVIAGSSLIPTSKSEIKRKIQDFFLNTRHYSSFEMSEKNLFKYFYDVNKWKPDFLRGYPSSIYFFAKFIQDNNLKLNFQPKAIFTTAEKLFDKQRVLIEGIFKAKVFDNYGLNDGGISAFECNKHCGFHVSTERAILEIVDNKGKHVVNQNGKILATSLYNYALPFIRYDTGDLGIISALECSCGRKTPLIKKIMGRTTEFLKLNNIVIGSPVLTVLMGKFDIEQYQIIQDNPSSIICKIIRGKTFKIEDENFIKKSFYGHVGRINIKFDYVDSILPTKAGKHKFIINNLKEV